MLLWKMDIRYEYQNMNMVQKEFVDDEDDDDTDDDDDEDDGGDDDDDDDDDARDVLSDCVLCIAAAGTRCGPTLTKCLWQQSMM